MATAKITLRASRDIPFNKLVLSQSNVLFAHCAALSINAVREPLNRNPQRLAHADALARAVNLDMAAASWRPTVDNYLARIPKARVRGISAANRSSEEAGDGQAGRRLLTDMGWPPNHCTTDAQIGSGNAGSEVSTDALPAFLAGAEDGSPDAEEPSHGVAAEWLMPEGCTSRPASSSL